MIIKHRYHSILMIFIKLAYLTCFLLFRREYMHQCDSALNLKFFPNKAVVSHVFIRRIFIAISCLELTQIYQWKRSIMVRMRNY